MLLTKQLHARLFYPKSISPQDSLTPNPSRPPPSLAYSYVVDALKKPPGSSMFTFGVEALRQFQGALPQLTPFAALLLPVRGGGKG